MSEITYETVCQAIGTSWRASSRPGITPDQYQHEWRNIASALGGMWSLVNYSDSYTPELDDDISLLREIAFNRWLKEKP